MPIDEKLEELFNLYMQLDNTGFSSLKLTDKDMHLQLVIHIQDAKIKILEAYKLLKEKQNES